MPNFQLPHAGSYTAVGSSATSPEEYNVPGVRDVESFRPTIDADVRNARALTVRGPRVLNLFTVSVPPGVISQVLGFDATRETITVNLWGGTGMLGTSRAAFEQFDINSSGQYFAMSSGAYFILHSQSELWCYNSDSSNQLVLSVAVEAN